jgi:hypothetical protein
VPKFSFAQLEWLWAIAGGGDTGGNPPKEAIAAAIAMAESGGCSLALAGPLDVRPKKECTYRVTYQENSHGLWQINLFAQPDSWSNYDSFSPGVNASMAVAVYEARGNFTPWTTYTNGAYKQYLPADPPAWVAPPQWKLGVDEQYLEAEAIDRDIFKSWDRLMRALAYTGPKQANRVRKQRYRIARAVRYPRR